jgi:hypothetical protein
VLRFRCRVCGGPRVPVTDPSYPRSGVEKEALGRAQRARFRRAAWAVTAGTLGGFGLLGALVAWVVMLVSSPGILAALALLAMVGTPLALAVVASAKSHQHRRELEAELELGWRMVAGELLEQSGDALSARRLGELMSVSESEAERLFVGLNATDQVESRVTEAGEVVYRARGSALGRWRVDDSEPVAAEQGPREGAGEPLVAERARANGQGR